MVFTFTRYSHNFSIFIDNDSTALLQRLGMRFLQNIQTLHLQSTLIYYLNADLSVYTDLTLYVFLSKILMSYAP